VKGQSKYHSIEETAVSYIFGFVLAILSQLIIFPFYGLKVSLSDNLQITGWFTIVSLVRTYIVRRIYNYRQVRAGNVRNSSS
jgi:hypothetical protein